MGLNGDKTSKVFCIISTSALDEMETADVPVTRRCR